MPFLEGEKTMKENNNRVTDNVEIEDAELRFRNFSGKEGKFNAKGNRNFCVLISDEAAKTLEADGWGIKYLKPRDEGDLPVPYMQVKVAYSDRSKPTIWLMTECDGEIINKNKLGEDDIDILDWAEIKRADLVIRPYNWEVQGKTGVKAYLKSMYVTIGEDKFARKYSDVPASAYGSVTGNDID